MQELDEALSAGKLHLHSNLGKAFRRAHAKGPASEAYANLGNDLVAKGQFRLNWAKEMKATLMLKIRTHEESYSEIDENLGTYVCFGRVVEAYGSNFDRETAVKSAQRYCLKCCKMGGKWTMYDHMAEILLFLLLERKHSEVMLQKWGLFEKHVLSSKDVQVVEKSPDPVDANVAGASVGAKPPAPLGSGDKRALPTSSDSADAVGKAPPVKRQRTELDKLITEAKL